jgi:hypothetical protein
MHLLVLIRAMKPPVPLPKILYACFPWPMSTTFFFRDSRSLSFAVNQAQHESQHESKPYGGLGNGSPILLLSFHLLV